MQGMKRAQVKWFNPEKGFGFLVIPNRPDLFFHVGDRLIRRYQSDASGEPKFLGSGKPWKPLEDRVPKRQGGDWIMFGVWESRDGRPKATDWDFVEEYDKAKYESLVLSGQPKTAMTFEVAAKLLIDCDFDCLRDCAFGDEEFGWHKDEECVATGYYGRGRYSVSMIETKFYLSTSFDGELAKRLYDGGGKTRHIERNDAGDPREW